MDPKDYDVRPNKRGGIQIGQSIANQLIPQCDVNVKGDTEGY